MLGKTRTLTMSAVTVRKVSGKIRPFTAQADHNQRISTLFEKLREITSSALSQQVRMVYSKSP